MKNDGQVLSWKVKYDDHFELRETTSEFFRRILKNNADVSDRLNDLKYVRLKKN